MPREKKARKRRSKKDQVIIAAKEGSLAYYFDTHKIALTMISELLVIIAVATKIENLLQVL